MTTTNLKRQALDAANLTWVRRDANRYQLGLGWRGAVRVVVGVVATGGTAHVLLRTALPGSAKMLVVGLLVALFASWVGERR